MSETVEYAPGRLLDLHGDDAEAVVLIWHGRGPNERSVLASLAGAVAVHGLRVVIPDWSSVAEDGGRTDLLTSARFAREHSTSLGLDPDRLTVVGWSLGATAAVGLTTHAKRLGFAVGATVLLAPGDGPRAVDAISGAVLPEGFPPGAGRSSFEIMYGARDDISNPSLVRGLDERLRASGWGTQLTELDVDHAGIVGTRFSSDRELCLPADDPGTLAARDRVASVIAHAASGTPAG